MGRNAPDEFSQIAQSAGIRLWVPTAAGSLANRRQSAQLLPDIGLWVATDNPYFSLRSRLRSYPIEEFLALVSRASILRSARGDDIFAAMRAEGLRPEAALRHYQMAYVIRLLLQEHSWQGARSWRGRSEADMFRELHDCTVQASNVLVEADNPDDDSPDAGWSTLVRIANQQFADFEGLRNFFPRALLLFGDCARDSEIANGVTLDELFTRQTGLRIETAIFLSLGIYGLLFEGKRGHILERDILTNSPDFPSIDQDLMDAYFSWLAVDYPGYCSACQEPAVNAEEAYEPYNFNPLVEHPFIRTPENHFILPIPHYLFRMVSIGCFYDLIRSCDPSRAGNIFGRAFEEYVALLIRDLPDHGELHGEFDYARGKKTCEWMLDEPSGVVVIECKRISLRQRSKSTGKRVDLKQDLGREGGIADGVKQLMETASAIQTGLVAGIDGTKRITGHL